MAQVLRGEIWWADLNPVRGHEQAGVRPVLIISHDSSNANSGTVIAMAITGQLQNAAYPLSVELSEKVLPRRSCEIVSKGVETGRTPGTGTAYPSSD